MAEKAKLTRQVTVSECPWLKEDLPEGKEVYEFRGHTYGSITHGAVAVSDEPDQHPFYQVPKDSVPFAAHDA